MEVARREEETIVSIHHAPCVTPSLLTHRPVLEEDEPDHVLAGRTSAMQALSGSISMQMRFNKKIRGSFIIPLRKMMENLDA
jgi:hypothetical protein